MFAMKSEDKNLLDAYRATGLTPAQIETMKQRLRGIDIAPLPFADPYEATVADYAWYAAEGVPGLLEESE